jgi:hypothetical protein
MDVDHKLMTSERYCRCAKWYKRERVNLVVSFVAVPQNVDRMHSFEKYDT